MHYMLIIFSLYPLFISCQYQSLSHPNCPTFINISYVYMYKIMTPSQKSQHLCLCICHSWLWNFWISFFGCKYAFMEGKHANNIQTREWFRPFFLRLKFPIHRTIMYTCFPSADTQEPPRIPISGSWNILEGETIVFLENQQPSYQVNRMKLQNVGVGLQASTNWTDFLGIFCWIRWLGSVGIWLVANESQM